MDAAVIRAMQKWPDVPAVSGWLSLDHAGHWRHHPQGDALGHAAGVGERILHAGLIRFLNRNYQSDTQGRWYVQNGPQRVYVRLDGAPLIFSLAADGQHLQDHTGNPVVQVLEWYLNAQGWMYLRTERGPGLIAGRDLPALAEQLRNTQGQGLDALELERPQHSRGWNTPAYPQPCPLTVWPACVSPPLELAYIALPETDPLEPSTESLA